MKVTPITLPGGSNTEVQWNNNGVFGADSNLVWNNITKMLGIGVSPASRVHAKSSVSSNQTSLFRAENDNSVLWQLGIFGSAAGTYGEIAANTAFLSSYSTADLLMLCEHASGVIRFATGASGGTERARITSSGLYLAEVAAAGADIAGKGQVWIKNTTPCEIWFTDDAGNDFQLGVGGGMTYKYIKASAQAEGDLHLSDGTNWNISKALIKYVRVVTSSTNWDLYVLQNDNTYAVDDANIPKMQIANGVNGNATLFVDLPYEDEDASGEVHLYYLDNSGANTADIYIQGLELS